MDYTITTNYTGLNYRTCSIDHDALLLANKGKFATLSCPDCKMVIETNPDLSERQRQIVIRKQLENMQNQRPVITRQEQTMSDEELAKIHASLMNGNYVKTRS